MDIFGISALSERTCQPCEGGVAPLSELDARAAVKELRGWALTGEGKAIRAEYVMKDFGAAIDLIARIAKIAEAQGHHPDLHLTGYRTLAVELSTHAIKGLSENDFIVAAKIEKLPRSLKA